jgi:hypothetical protein
MASPASYKLGKKPAVFDPRTLLLGKFVSKLRLDPPPASRVWSIAVGNRWQMYRNDEIGDCGPVGAAHQHMCWSANSDGVERIYVPTIQEVIKVYSDVGGYVEGQPWTDNGIVMLDLMKYWRLHGFSGRRIGAFASLAQPNAAIDRKLFMAAVNIFGGVAVGLRLPKAAQNYEVWKAPARQHRFGRWAPNSWGGHYVPVFDYDQQLLTCVTWGAKKQMSWAFLEAYADEAYVQISEDWLNDAGKAPNGFDMTGLGNALAVITGGNPKFKA